jgi:peptide/nickel transport system permease protein
MSVDRLSEAQQALQRGERIHARKLVSQVLFSDQQNEQAWLMMARLVDTEQQVIECLERALKINPQNASTKSALTVLGRKSGTKPKPIAASLQSGTLHLAVPEMMVAPVQLQRVEMEEKPVSLSQKNNQGALSPHRKVNWSLVAGSIIVLSVVILAILGPRLAPQDPMEEHSILHQGDEWIIPPFSAFEVKGYILGSDEFGRDMLSRILYAIRPTLIMVSIVAVVRLFLGTIIGLGAGWSTGRMGRFLDGMISAALSVPILLVALFAIAMLGAEIGILAFIVGLSINGWGETARFVSEQTRLTKGQLYIESARSLGATSFQMLSKHILRQIMPMVWMLFAFEISGTLMVTAGLGFLGYFIGGDVWVEVSDFVSRRTSGSPELGQMLATSYVNLLEPWPLVLTGSVIFVTVLGFNLLGDGLRSRLSPEYINRNSPFAILSQRVSQWFEGSISYPVSNWFKANRLRPFLVISGVIALTAIIYLYQTRVANRFNPSETALTVPGGQIWASDRIDPYGTYYLNSIGPEHPQELWIISHPAGFSGNPVISTDGTIYLAGLDSILIALNPDGTLRWKASLPQPPLGSLAIGPQGILYVSDATGGVTAFTSEGNILWTYNPGQGGRPIHGPIVSPNGTIYYLLEDARGDTLVALLPNGQLLWSVQPGTRAADTALRLTPDGEQIFVKTKVVNASDGSIVDITLPTQNDPVLANQANLFVGADGKTYLLAGHVVVQWELTSQGFSIVQSADWNYRGAGISQTSGFPADAGVTPDGNIWIFYSGYYGGTSLYWLDPTGKILGDYSGAYNENTRLIATDGTGTAYICGFAYSSNQGPASVCEAFPQDSTRTFWSYTLPEDVQGVIGGAMAQGRLYVITPDGLLIALGDSLTTNPVGTSSP